MSCQGSTFNTLSPPVWARSLLNFLRNLCPVIRSLSFWSLLAASLLWQGERSALFASQVPLLGEQPYLAGEAASVQYEWKAAAARAALESGLSATAADIFSSLLEDMELAANDRIELSLDYVAALIAQASYRKASDVLATLPVLYDANRRRLYQASILYGEASTPNPESIRAELTGIDPDALTRFDLPWFFLLQGMVADIEGHSDDAKTFFKKAENAALSPMQSALFSSLVLRQQILKSQADESLLVEIREKFEALAGRSAAFPFLLEYLVLLHGMGRQAEAIDILEAELTRADSGYSADERANLRLLKGLILGHDSSAGWASLESLVRTGVDSEATVIALQLLASVTERQADLLELLSEIIAQPEPYPLIAQLYYMRCQLALANPDMIDLAEADARHLLDQFPGFSEIASVYRLLAYAALQRTPPRYRVAADYLLDLRERSSEPHKIAELNRLIGDCYFLNSDYSNAVDFYDLAYSGIDSESGAPNLLLRLVISQIRSGKYEEAVTKIDQASFAGQIGVTDHWRAEWSIALALQANGQAERALERLRSVIRRDAEAVPVLLDLRMRWLEAYISLQLDESSGVDEKLDVLLARIESMPPDALGPEESSRLKSELLLLKSETMLALDDVAAAFDVIATIRSEFRGNVAAQRTYFTEAAYHASVEDFLAAREVLRSFADDYPGSTLIPQALFEAALHSQRQGPDHYGEAVILLDRLVQDHPGSDLVYYAGLKQGDLLRLMNNFAGAQLIYENLINRFPSHRLRYAAELSRADCIAALAQGEGQLAEALAILERLLDQPDIPVEVRIEAGYKWGNILTRNQDTSAAKTVFGLVTSRYLLDSTNAAALTLVGRYWLSRSVFSLGELLEHEGDLREAEKLYRRLVAFNLPGRSFALARINQLRRNESL